MAEIVVTEFLDEAALTPAREVHDVVYEPSLHDDRSALLVAVRGAEGLIVRNKTRVDPELLSAAPNLRVVGRLGVGLDNIDLDACDKRGIVVRPATGANAVAVAEYVMGALLVLRRGVFGATDDVVAGGWPRQSLMGEELSGATLGLIGYGLIAREVASRAAAFGMTVLAFDPFLGADADWAPASRCDLEDLLVTSDAISLHVPLTPSTRHLISTETLSTMRSTALVVNTSRGGVVDELAVAAAIRQGRLGGAALDVFTTEPVSEVTRDAFRGLGNILLTPHVAGVTTEANRRVSAVTVAAVVEELAR